MDTEAPAPPRKGGADPEWRAQPNPVAKAAEGGSALDHERRHLGPKAADALDGATEARGSRRGRPATDARATKGARGIAAERAWSRTSSNAKGGSAEGETRQIIHKEPLSLHRFWSRPGEPDANGGALDSRSAREGRGDRGETKAMTEASDAASTESSSRKGESNNP